MNNSNLFSIGEIASAIGITRKIILNHEAKGLIKPDKKDGSSANRYYTIDTFTHIRTIRIFQDLGLSLDEIREYFNNLHDLRPTIELLEGIRYKLTLTIEKLKERSDIISEIIIEPQTVYTRRYNSVTVEDKTNLLRDTALEATRKFGTDTTRRTYFTELSVSAPKEVSYSVAVPPQSNGEHVEKLPKKRAILLFHHGAHEDIPKKREKSNTQRKTILLSGIFRSLYLEGPPQHKDKSKFITPVIATIEDLP